MESVVLRKALVLKVIFLFAFVFTVDSESKIEIDVANSTLVELESYVDDLKIAASSAAYTAELNLRYVGDLQKALQDHKVFCQERFVVRPDYERVEQGVFYKLHSGLLTWNLARKKCESEGARLAVFMNSNESESLVRTLTSRKISKAFLGVHSFFEDGNWVMISSESIQNPDLIPREINDSSLQLVRKDSSRRCGAITKSAHVTRADCDAANAFFCEIRWKQRSTEKSQNSIP